MIQKLRFAQVSWLAREFGSRLRKESDQSVSVCKEKEEEVTTLRVSDFSRVKGKMRREFSRVKRKMREAFADWGKGRRMKAKGGRVSMRVCQII